MGRFIADQNKVVLLHESGTYANTSGNGFWIGQVTENTIEDAENKIVSRYLGTASRSLDSVELGPRDVTGTLTYNPQDMRIPFIALGSIVDTSGTNSTHVVSEINTNSRLSAYTSGTLNPPFSFTVEDSKQSPGTGQNFIRTVNGVVPNSVTLSSTQGEKVQCAVDYLGQTLTYSSGNTTSVTEVTNTPYLWNHGTITVSGLVLDTAKDWSFEINNNVEAPHYVNGSRDISVPYPKNRDYTLTVTFDGDSSSDKAKTLYNTLYKTNSVFNATIDLDADSSAGSQHAIFALSGCRVTTMDIPSPLEGANEFTMEIMAEHVSGVSYDSTAATALYNPW